MKYIKKLFNINVNQEELSEFCVNHKADGGLELMIPGKYYDTMKTV